SPSPTTRGLDETPRRGSNLLMKLGDDAQLARTQQATAAIAARTVLAPYPTRPRRIDPLSAPDVTTPAPDNTSPERDDGMAVLRDPPNVPGGPPSVVNHTLLRPRREPWPGRDGKRTGKSRSNQAVVRRQCGRSGGATQSQVAMCLGAGPCHSSRVPNSRTSHPIIRAARAGV